MGIYNEKKAYKTAKKHYFICNKRQNMYISVEQQLPETHFDSEITPEETILQF